MDLGIIETIPASREFRVDQVDPAFSFCDCEMVALAGSPCGPDLGPQSLNVWFPLKGPVAGEPCFS